MLPVEPGLPRLRTTDDRTVSARPMPALRSSVRRLLWLALAGLLALLGATTLARFHWLAELTTHFAVYWALAGLVISGLAVLLGARRLALVAAVVAGLHAFHVWPYLPGLGAAEARAGTAAEPLRVLSINVLSRNRNHYAVEGLIREHRPDVVALLEITDRWLMGLKDLEADYPYRVARSQADNFGIALFSRLPIEDLEITSLVRQGLPMVRGRIDLGGTPIHLFAVHPVPPSGAGLSMLRDLQIEGIAELVHALPGGGEAIVMGDLNTTPWSPIHRAFEATTGLRNAARGHGIVNTWPTQYAPVMIPLDHVLVSKGLGVRSIRTLDTNGSDHLGVLVDLDLHPNLRRAAAKPGPQPLGGLGTKG